MKFEFNWVKSIKVGDIVTISPDDPKKEFCQRKIFINTGKEFYTLILNGSYKNNIELKIKAIDTIDQKTEKTTSKKSKS